MVMVDEEQGVLLSLGCQGDLAIVCLNCLIDCNSNDVHEHAGLD